MTSDLPLHEITDIRDSKIKMLLRLIEQAFPPEEMMPPSFWIALFQQKTEGEAENFRIFVLPEEESEDEARALMMYDYSPGETAATLWYLAVKASERGKGLGLRLLRNLEHRLAANPECRAILFEIERADQARSPEGLKQVLDRERFYRRWGARIARNIEYHQSVGSWQPITPMSLCVYALDSELTDAEIRALFAAGFASEGEGGIKSLPDEIHLE